MDKICMVKGFLTLPQWLYKHLTKFSLTDQISTGFSLSADTCTSTKAKL